MPTSSEPIRGTVHETRWLHVDVSELAEQPLEFRQKLRNFALFLWILPMAAAGVLILVSALAEYGFSFESIFAAVATFFLGFATFSIVIIPYLILSSWVINKLLDSEFAARILWTMRQYALKPFGRAKTVQYAVWRMEERTTPVRIDVRHDADGASLHMQTLEGESVLDRDEIFLELPDHVTPQSAFPQETTIPLRRPLSVQLTKPPTSQDRTEGAPAHLTVRDPKTKESATFQLDCGVWLDRAAYDGLDAFVHRGVVCLDEDAQESLVASLHQTFEAVGVALDQRLRVGSAVQKKASVARS